MPSELLSGYRVGKPDGGPECEAFERELEAYYNVPYARVFNSCTAAMHSALVAMGCMGGQRVNVPALTMSASAAAVLQAGGKLLMCDIGDDYLSQAPPDDYFGEPAMVFVHLFGHHGVIPTRLASVHDCAQSPSLRPDPSRKHDIWCYSLNQHKIVSCGEGGYALTFSKLWADRLHAMRNHGECYTPDILGYNYRMTEPIAAIARREFRDLDRRLDARRKWADAVQKEYDLPPDHGNVDWFVYPVRIEPKHREIFAKRIRGARVGYHTPIYRLPYFASIGSGIVCPNAEKIESELVVINPMEYGL